MPKYRTNAELDEENEKLRDAVRWLLEYLENDYGSLKYAKEVLEEADKAWLANPGK